MLMVVMESCGACYKALQPCRHGQLSACLEDSNCVTSETTALLLTLPSPLQPILRAPQGQWSTLPCRWIGLAVGDVSSKHDTLQNQADKAAFSYTKHSFLLLPILFVSFKAKGKRKIMHVYLNGFLNRVMLQEVSGVLLGEIIESFLASVIQLCF